MSRRSEQTFFSQRRQINDQQGHKRVPNITNDQGNANQNNEISPSTYQNGFQQKENK